MSHLRALKRETTDLLTELGRTPDEVAASFEAAGVAGLPRSNRSCAVALYLSAVLGAHPRVRSVAVGHCSVAITLVSVPDQRPAGRLLVQLPKPVRQFVAAFDAEQYPDLTRQRAPRPVPPLVAAG
jgi:hypothetical protein